MLIDTSSPPEDLAQKKTASGQTGGDISNGAEGSNLNNQSITEPDDKSKGNDGWGLVETTVEKPVVDQLSTLRIAVYQGYLWRKTEDGFGYERKLRPESSQDTPPAPTGNDETGKARQTKKAKADSASRRVEKVKAYRRFEGERLVADRLFGDGFLEILSSAAVKVLLFLGSKSNDENKAQHTLDTIAKVIGIKDTRTIGAAVDELKEHKLISVTEVKGKPNIYRLL